MKKLLAIILAVGMLLCLAACQGDVNTESNVSENSSAPAESVGQSDNAQTTTSTTEKAEDAQSTSATSSATQSTTAATTTKAACSHKYSAASCTAAAKCSLCGVTKGKALGHSYAAGKCTRCGAKDNNYATYKAGGKDSIIRTTLGGKSTTLKIDISKANERFQNISSFASSPNMTISYTKFLEVDGWLFFAQTVNIKYKFRNVDYDIIVDEVFKIKTDGTSQTALTTYQMSEDKGMGVSEVFGFDAANIYYVLENEDEGICEIYKAPVSANLTNLVKQGKKIAGSPTAYATIWKCSVKDGYLYFSEKSVTYDPSVSAAVSKDLGNYKMKLDGTGLSKIS